MASYEVESLYLTLPSDTGKYSLRHEEKRGGKNQINLHFNKELTARCLFQS